MSLENFILTCEKDNEQLRKDVDYYKNYNKRLKKEIDQLKEQLEASEKARKEAIELLEKHLEAKSYGNHKYELFSREYLEELLKILYVDKG